MEEFGKLEERVVLVGVQTDDHDNVEESLDELKELASTAGAVTVGRIIQNRESVHPGTYIGKGKIEEVRALVYAMDATGIICDDDGYYEGKLRGACDNLGIDSHDVVMHIDEINDTSLLEKYDSLKDGHIIVNSDRREQLKAIRQKFLQELLE